MKPLFSILTMYNCDPSIFDNFQLPKGIEKNDVLNNMLMELAELEVLYSNPDMMKAAIGFWSKKELPVWTKLVETTKFEYNPIWNFDRTEEYTDKETRDLSGTDNETRNLAGTSVKHSETTGTTTNSGTDTQKEYVSGFNEATPTLSKQGETTLGSGNSVTGNVDTTDNSTDTGTDNRTSTNTGTVDITHNARLFGNIGVTTTQQMIEAERKVVQFNITNYIIDSFKGRFCILIY